MDPRRPQAGGTRVHRPFAAGPPGMGLALIGGFVLHICAVAGTVMVGLMWVAEQVPAQYLADGSRRTRRSIRSPTTTTSSARLS